MQSDRNTNGTHQNCPKNHQLKAVKQQLPPSLPYLQWVRRNNDQCLEGGPTSVPQVSKMGSLITPNSDAYPRPWTVCHKNGINPNKQHREGYNHFSLELHGLQHGISCFLDGHFVLFSNCKTVSWICITTPPSAHLHEGQAVYSSLFHTHSLSLKNRFLNSLSL